LPAASLSLRTRISIGSVRFANISILSLVPSHSTFYAAVSPIQTLVTASEDALLVAAGASLNVKKMPVD
jgi:hypothetical protein